MASSKHNGLVGLIGAGVFLVAPGAEAARTPARLTAPGPARVLFPPPADAIHGYAHDHRSGARLRFDSDLGVYTVGGASGVYFFGDAFIRHRDDRWEFSARPTGPWTPGRSEWVPWRLRAGLYRGAR